MLAESHMMCAKCFSLADDSKSLLSQPCPKAFDFGEPNKMPSEAAPNPPQGVDNTERKKQLQLKLEKAEREIKRLSLLKRLQQERAQLAELLAKKRNSSGFLS